MKIITKKYEGKVYAFDAKAYNNKGGWFIQGAKDTFGRAAKKEVAEKLGNPNQKKPLSADAIVKINDGISYIWAPKAYGKGYWYTLSDNNDLGRPASKTINEMLGRPEEKVVEEPVAEVVKKSVAKEKVKKEKVEKPQKPAIKQKEVKETKAVEDTMTERSDIYKRNDKLYKKAEKVRDKGLSKLIAEKISSGQGLGESISGGFKENFEARMTGIKEKFDLQKKFDLMNIGKAIAGPLGAALVGSVTNRSTKDIQYFTGMKAKDLDSTSTQMIPEAINNAKEGQLETKTKKYSEKSYSKNIDNATDDELVNALKKLYNTIVKVNQKDVRVKEIERDFKDEKDAEQRKFLENLLGSLDKKKEVKETAKKEPQIEDTNMILGNVIELIGDIISLGGPAFKALSSTIAKIAIRAAPLLGRALLVGGPMGLIVGGMGIAIENSLEEQNAIRADVNHPLHKQVMAADAAKKQRHKNVTSKPLRRDDVQRLVDANIPDDQLKQEYKSDHNQLEKWLSDNPDKKSVYIVPEVYTETKKESIIPVEDSNKKESITPVDFNSADGAASATSPAGPSNEQSQKTVVDKIDQTATPVSSKEDSKNTESDTSSATQVPSATSEDNKVMDSDVAGTQTTVTPSAPEAAPTGERVQAATNQNNDLQNQDAGKVVPVNINNSKVIGSSGKGGSTSVNVVSNATVRIDDPTLLQCQFQNMRMV